MTWTADDLVAAVRVRAQLPASAGDGAMTDADILTLANEEISLRLVPLVRRSRGDYFVSIHDVPIVNGTGAYRVPERAQTSGLREVTILDPSGREWPVPQMHLEDAGPSQIYGGGWDAVRFYMRGPDVVLVPTPTYPDCTLRMYYHRSHSELVPNSETGTVQWAGGGDSDCLLSDFPAAWSSLTFGFTADIYYQKPPFGIQAMSASVTNVTGDVATIYQVATLGMTAGALYGIAYAHKTSVVDLPRECWPLLVSALTARVCEVIGDRDAAALAYGLYDREAANVTLLLTPRIEGNPIRIVDRNSLLRSQRRW